MKAAEYRVCISSPPDRERLVAELFLDNIQWAELNQERAELVLELYPRPDGQPWTLDFKEAIRALEEAKEKLAR